MDKEVENFMFNWNVLVLTISSNINLIQSYMQEILEDFQEIQNRLENNQPPDLMSIANIVSDTNHLFEKIRVVASAIQSLDGSGRSGGDR